MRTSQVAIIGLGVMGSAALYSLRRRGVDVVGFDPIAMGGQEGSSHGSCRIYRRFNFESPAYTALSDRAYSGWRDLEAACETTILLPSRLVEAGPAGSPLVAATLEAAGAAACARSSDEIHAEFPGLRLPDDWIAAEQSTAGILLAQAALGAFRAGADDCVISAAVQVTPHAHGFELRTRDGDTFAAQRLILTAGPWVTEFVPQLIPYITVSRQAVGWFEPADPPKAAYPDFPLFIFDTPELVYGFPDFEGRGVKAACHAHGPRVDPPGGAGPEADFRALQDVWRVLRNTAPAAAGRLVHRESCLYTNTAGGDVDGSAPEEFILDRLPADPRVIVASPCSGHGFKFAPAIGELLADLVLEPAAEAPGAFSLKRYRSFA